MNAATTRESRWRRFLVWLLKPCPFGNRHFRWTRLCSCGSNYIDASKHCEPSDRTHGWCFGYYDFARDEEVFPVSGGGWGRRHIGFAPTEWDPK